MIKEVLTPEFLNLTALALPTILLTINQAQKILQRDQNTCQFPFPHDHSKKLTIHHISFLLGKADVPENLVCVCRVANWDYLHNGHGEEEETKFAIALDKIARENTERAKNINWNDF